MMKLIPVLMLVLALGGCTIQALQTDNPTLDSMEGFKYSNPKATSGTVSGFFLFPSFGSIGGLLKLEGSDAMYQAAYNAAKDAVGADCLIHYSYEIKIDWYWIVGWAHVTCTGTGVNYN